MVPTPALAASASSSAISASDRPGSCWRVSAQNHWGTTPVDSLPPSVSNSDSSKGRISAAPNSMAPSAAKPATSPVPSTAINHAAASNAPPPTACSFRARSEARLQARGLAGASSGMVAMRHSREAADTSVPATAMARPSPHTDGLIDSVPGTSAP